MNYKVTFALFLRIVYILPLWFFFSELWVYILPPLWFFFSELWVYILQFSFFFLRVQSLHFVIMIFFLRIFNLYCNSDFFPQNSEFISWDFFFFFSEFWTLYLVILNYFLRIVYILQFRFFFLRIEFTFCNHEFISHNLVIFFSQNSASASCSSDLFYSHGIKEFFSWLFFLRIAIYKVIIVRQKVTFVFFLFLFRIVNNLL